MTRNRMIALVATVALAAASALLVLPLKAAGTDGCCKPEIGENPNQAKAACPASGPSMTADQLSTISKSINLAIRQLQEGKTAAALTELRQAKAFIAKITPSRPVMKTAAAPEPKFINTRCPIMGSPIDPAKVPASLARDYKGHKVAFCCGGCPGEWERLSDAQKQAKLSKVMPPAR